MISLNINRKFPILLFFIESCWTPFALCPTSISFLKPKGRIFDFYHFGLFTSHLLCECLKMVGVLHSSQFSVERVNLDQEVKNSCQFRVVCLAFG